MRGISRRMLGSCAGLRSQPGLLRRGRGRERGDRQPRGNHREQPGFHCNPFAGQQWNLNGSNTVNAVFMGTTYSYSITFKQFGNCLSGTMTHSYYPTTGPIYGTVRGNHVTFSFTYPAGFIQGTRTFNGYITPVDRQWYRQGHRWHFRGLFRVGSVSGKWSDNGTENGSGPFSLSNNVRNACPSWAWGPTRASSANPSRSASVAIAPAARVRPLTRRRDVAVRVRE